MTTEKQLEQIYLNRFQALFCAHGGASNDR